MRPSPLSMSMALALSSTVAVTAVDDVHLKTQVEGMALIATFLEQAQTVQNGGSVSDAQIDAVFA